MAETKPSAYTLNLPVLDSTGSIPAAIQDGASVFRIDVDPEWLEEHDVTVGSRIAVIDRDLWRGEFTVSRATYIEPGSSVLLLDPADVDGLPAHAIKGRIDALGNWRPCDH